MKECWFTEDEPNNLLDQVFTLQHRVMVAREIAKKNLEQAQGKMKVWYDKRAKKSVADTLSQLPGE